MECLEQVHGFFPGLHSWAPERSGGLWGGGLPAQAEALVTLPPPPMVCLALVNHVMEPHHRASARRPQMAPLSSVIGITMSAGARGETLDVF